MPFVAEHTKSSLLVTQSSYVLTMSFGHDAFEVSGGGKSSEDSWRHDPLGQRLSTLICETRSCIRTVGSRPHDFDVNLHDDPLIANN